MHGRAVESGLLRSSCLPMLPIVPHIDHAGKLIQHLLIAVSFLTKAVFHEAKAIVCSSLWHVNIRNFHILLAKGKVIVGCVIFCSCIHILRQCFVVASPLLDNISWTEGLDAAFTQNHPNMPSAWQYFASSAGFMRYFPGWLPLHSLALS